MTAPLESLLFPNSTRSASFLQHNQFVGLQTGAPRERNDGWLERLCLDVSIFHVILLLIESCDPCTETRLRFEYSWDTHHASDGYPVDVHEHRSFCFVLREC